MRQDEAMTFEHPGTLQAGDGDTVNDARPSEAILVSTDDDANANSRREAESASASDSGEEDVAGDEADADKEVGSDGDIVSQVEQPAKVMRIGTMIKQLLEEVRAAPLDEAGRRRLKDIHHASIKELQAGLALELRDELERLTLPFDEDHLPSEPELRIAQAQLVGWLEGLFHGIQTALFAQSAAREQLEEMRKRALPGHVGPGGVPGMPGMAPTEREHGTGQYL
jgi:hypothetical protein